MFERIKLKKQLKYCQDIYRKKRDELDDLYDRFEHIIKKKKCGLCSTYNSGNVSKFSERFKKCDSKCSEDVRNIAERMDELKEDIDNYVQNEYSSGIFKYYSVVSPTLKERISKEKISWEEAFGKDFEKLPPDMRSSLIGLLEGGGKYSFE